MSFAVVVGAVIGLAGTAYSMHEQKKNAKELADEEDKAIAEASAAQQMSIKQDAVESSNESKKVKFGTGEAGDDLGSYGDFYSKNKTKKAKQPMLGFGTSTSGVQV